MIDLWFDASFGCIRATRDQLYDLEIVLIQKATIMRNVAVKEALGIWWRLFAASVSELLASS